MRQKTLTIAGTDIGYAVTGQGPPLVLLAGLGSTSRVWGDLPKLLGGEATVITIDNRGVGASRAAGGFSIARVAADVIAVLNVEGHERAAVLGASMGGVIALEAACSFPSRIDRLVIASSAIRLSVHGRRVMTTLRDLIEHLPPAAVGAALMTFAFAPPATTRFPAIVQQVAETYGLDPADRAGARAQAEHLLTGWDLRPRAADCHVPTLVLAGARDPVVAIEDVRELAHSLPVASLAELPDAGHSVLAEGGREVLDRVVGFLRSR